MNETKLEELKVGDLVYTTKYESINISKIERITKTQIITKTEKYNRKSGRCIGGDWLTPNIYPVTPDILVKSKILKLKNNIVNLSKIINNVTEENYDDIKKYYDIIHGLLKKK